MCLLSLSPRILGLILGCQVLWGVGLTFISGADNAWLADEVGEEQLGAVLVVGSQLSQLAGIIGLAGAVGLGVFRHTLAYWGKRCPHARPDRVFDF